MERSRSGRMMPWPCRQSVGKRDFMNDDQGPYDHTGSLARRAPPGNPSLPGRDYA
jgi:hypothetical protein